MPIEPLNKWLYFFCAILCSLSMINSGCAIFFDGDNGDYPVYYTAVDFCLEQKENKVCFDAYWKSSSVSYDEKRYTYKLPELKLNIGLQSGTDLTSIKKDIDEVGGKVNSITAEIINIKTHLIKIDSKIDKLKDIIEELEPTDTNIDNIILLYILAGSLSKIRYKIDELGGKLNSLSDVKNSLDQLIIGVYEARTGIENKNTEIAVIAANINYICLYLDSMARKLEAIEKAPRNDQSDDLLVYVVAEYVDEIKEDINGLKTKVESLAKLGSILDGIKEMLLKLFDVIIKLVIPMAGVAITLNLAFTVISVRNYSFTISESSIIVALIIICLFLFYSFYDNKELFKSTHLIGADAVAEKVINGINDELQGTVKRQIAGEMEIYREKTSEQLNSLKDEIIDRIEKILPARSRADEVRSIVLGLYAIMLLKIAIILTIILYINKRRSKKYRI